MNNSRSVVRNYLIWSLIAGIAMGAVFPLFSLLFVANFKSTACFIVFAFSCVLAGIIVGLVSFLTGKATIIRFIKKVSFEMHEIAQGRGDLTKRLAVRSNDGIGEMARYFNEFMEKLQQILEQIAGNTLTVAASAAGLSDVSTRIAASAEEMSAQTSVVSSSTRQATTNINSISSAAEEMSAAVGSIAAAIDTLSASLDEVAKNCAKELQIAVDADSNALKSKEIIDRLGITAKSIGNIIQVIGDIAGKANLLALNATIEAAGSGEAGKGFAVVAHEIKELSRQTAQSAQQIQGQIEDMQSNTIAAVASIDHVARVIEEVKTISQTIVSAVEKQSATISEIAQRLSVVSAGAREVSHNVTASAQGLSEVAATIHEVSNAVNDTARGIAQVKTSADGLANLSENLKKLTGQFKA